MRPKLTISLFSEVVAGLLVFLFLYTAYSKARYPADFIGAMLHNPLLSPYVYLLSWLVPAAEFVIVILLFIPRTRKIGMLSSIVLLSIFSVYIGYMLITSSDLPCTCGGILEDMTWNQHFVFNLVMMILSLTAWICSSKRFVATNRDS